MGERSEYPHGHFCWVDLMSRDFSDAKQFYASVLDWESDDQDTQGGPPYACFQVDKRKVAGLGEMNDEMRAAGVPPVWNSYIQVEDLETIVAQASQLGATVLVPPLQVVQAGSMAVLQTPSGEAISLWQAMDHYGAELVNEPKTWVWNELITPDPGAAIGFYESLFGWTFEEEQASENQYWTAKNGETLNAGLMKRPVEMGECPAHWTVYFSTEDIDAALERIVAAGGSVLKEKFEVEVGEIVVVSDNQGAAFQLIKMKVPVDA